MKEELLSLTKDSRYEASENSVDLPWELPIKNNLSPFCLCWMNKYKCYHNKLQPHVTAVMMSLAASVTKTISK